jgi:hypothetical protein
LVFGQTTTKDMQITITNGDTTINGKNIKDLSPADRKDALKDIGQIASINNPPAPPHPPMMANGNMSSDRHVKILKMYSNGGGKDSTVTLNYSMDNGPRHKMEIRDDHFNKDGRGHEMKFVRRNTQNFTYNNIDNDGIVTRVSYHVSDHHAILDYDAGKQEDSQMDMLDLVDLSIVPEFSQGKTTLMFSLPSKAPAQVTFKDGKGNLLWSAKTVNGAFSKSFAMGLNGIYYLQIKQGSKIAVKEIEKE